MDRQQAITKAKILRFAHMVLDVSTGRVTPYLGSTVSSELNSITGKYKRYIKDTPSISAAKRFVRASRQRCVVADSNAEWKHWQQLVANQLQAALAKKG